MKKGFTLIEMLAVIVILSIIALIVTPVVSNIVANARIAANKRSVEGHIKNVEIAIISRAFRGETTGDTDAFDNITQGSVIEESLTRTDGDNVTCDAYEIEHGKVINAYLCNDVNNKWNKLYNYNLTDGASILDFKGTVLWPGLDSNGNPTENRISSTLSIPMAGEDGKSTVNYLGIVYIDPSDLSKECLPTTSITIGNTGCKKFYIYNKEGNTYKMISDRNVGSNVKWISDEDFLKAGGTEEEWGTDGNNSKGSITLNNALSERTVNWIGNPRLITVAELRTISGYTSTSTFYFGSNGSTTYANQNDSQKDRQKSYHWLFDYSASATSYGGKVNSSTTNGYWLSSKSSTNKGWNVTRAGRVATSVVSAANFGVRPVITLPKALIG